MFNDPRGLKYKANPIFYSRAFTYHMSFVLRPLFALLPFFVLGVDVAQAGRPSKKAPAKAPTEVKTIVSLLSGDTRAQRTLAATSGVIGEEDLIRLAIARDPGLQKLRSAIRIAKAEEAAAHDFENPEIRFGYGWQEDDFLTQPYTETRSESLSFRQSEFQQGNFTNLEDGTTLTNERISTSGTRFRDVERRVTPGRYRDVVETRYFERRQERRNNTETRTNGANSLDQRVESGERADARREVGRTREVINHPDAFGSEESFSVLLRFRTPHPWERRARIQRAIAEISLAEAEYLAAEDKLVREVRDLHADICFREGELTALAKRRSYQEALTKDMSAVMLNAGARDYALRARLDATKLMLDSAELRSESDSNRAALASLCGISTPRAISSRSLPARRILDADSLSVSYLTQMALVYRGDVLEAKARLAIAQALLAEQRAAAIPFATFVDAGWSRQWSEGRTGDRDEWIVRVGITLPLFEWAGINKKKKQYQESAEAWQELLTREQEKITADITAHVSSLSDASSGLEAATKELEEIKAAFKAADAERTVQSTLPEIPGLDSSINDLNRAKRTEYEIKDLEQQVEISRIKLYRDYHKNFMQLEAAIGTRLDKVLPATRSTR